ncbi:Gfo/Idh/MocA family oxidoreductase, partial [Pirellulales bacterium]|nr:Gfo/Idh/MocA family oxidoreductase [Pirellulales bacterium]
LTKFDSKSTNMATISRRTFSKRLGAGMSLAVGASNLNAVGANERVNVALVGCGVRGRAFFGRVSAVCDPDVSRLAAAAKACNLNSSQAVTDLRRILDDRLIDAVVIATPDHWHAPAAILACLAGKHVYVEKPVSHNFRENQLLLRAARRSGVVVQHGTHHRSNPFIQEAVQSLREGLIGEVLIAKAWNIQHRESIGHAKPSDPPAGVDYDMWVGPAEHVPFQANRFHYNWHWWRKFGTGDIGNDGTHEIDYARWGLGVESLPSHVSAVGGKYYFDDQQEFPDTVTCTAEYREDASSRGPKQLIFEMRLWSRNYPINCDSGVEFLGTEGQMLLSKRGKLIVRDPENNMITEKRATKQPGFPHFENFTDAIRNGTPVNATLTDAHRTVSIVHLANVSQQAGRSILLDADSEQIADDPQASQLLGRTYRKNGHWAVPKSA